MSRSELVSARGNCRDSTMAPRSRSRAKRPIAVEPSMVARGQHRGHRREPAPAAGRASDRKASRLGSQRARRPWPGAPRAGLLSGALARTPGDGRPPREARGARVRNRPSAGVLAPPGSLAAASPKSPPAACPWRGSPRLRGRASRFIVGCVWARGSWEAGGATAVGNIAGARTLALARGERATVEV